MTALSGDRALWLARHVLPHEPALRAWLSRWRLDDLDTDDIIQDTYAVLAGRPSVADIHNPRAYCFQTARSIILMHLRRSKIVSIRAVEDLDRLGPVAEEPSPEQQVSDREQLHRLSEALAELPELGRRALVLRFIDDLPQHEVGRRMGISENAAQKHIAKSVLKLMNLFGRGGKDVVQASTTESKPMPVPDDHARRQSVD